jgi:hypothetical protein
MRRFSRDSSFLILCTFGLGFAGLQGCGGAQGAAPVAVPGGAQTASRATGSFGARVPQVVPVSSPIGVAVDQSDNLYVSNHATRNGQILIYDKNGNQLGTITAGIENPTGLAFAEDGLLYVSNARSRTITVYDQSWDQLSDRTISSDPNYEPGGVQAIRGKLWVSNRKNSQPGVGEIQVFSIATREVLFLVTQGLQHPLGITFGPYGDVWVCNNNDPYDTITVYNHKGTLSRSILVSGFTPAYDAFWKRRMFVTDEVHSVIGVFDLNGGLIGEVKVGLSGPHGIAFDSQGNFYVANATNSTVSEYNSSWTLIRTIH